MSWRIPRRFRKRYFALLALAVIAEGEEEEEEGSEVDTGGREEKEKRGGERKKKTLPSFILPHLLFLWPQRDDYNV